MRAGYLGVLALSTLFGASSLHAEAPVLPPYVGAYQPQGGDEIGLWRQADEGERELANSALVIQDEKLTAYVHKVLCDAVGQDRCGAARVYIMREPTFNATMAPNGAMRVYSGLLLRIRNEAELAAVLGHEFGHFEARHSLQEFKSKRRGTDLLAWSAVLLSLSAPSYNSYRSHQNLQLAVYGDFFRYNRNQEREADALGVAYLNASRLRPRAASVVWQNQMAEYDASARVRGLKKPDYSTIAFTASHPPELERAVTLAALAAPDDSMRDEGVERYRDAMAQWLPVFLDDQIKLNDFGASDHIIQSLAENGWTAELWFARGELYRTRGNQRDLTHAAEYYAQALEASPELAAAHRGIGLSFMKTGRLSEAHAALRTYLHLKPDAKDAAMIRAMLPVEEASF